MKTSWRFFGKGKEDGKRRFAQEAVQQLQA
jgi:hypothetical protein